MYADLFFLNKFFSASLADIRDSSPAAFSIFYVNMNIASMHLLALCIFLTLCILVFLIGRICQSKYQTQIDALFTFLYNYFIFGMTFAGCASLQGAIINPI